MFYIDNLVTIHNKFLSFANKINLYETHRKAIVKVKSDFYYLDKGKNEVKHICKVGYENRHLLDSMQECGIYNLNTPFDYTQEEEENPYTHEILGFILSDLESKDYLQDEFFSFHLQALGFKEQEEVIESMQELERAEKEYTEVENRESEEHTEQEHIEVIINKDLSAQEVEYNNMQEQKKAQIESKTLQETNTQEVAIKISKEQEKYENEKKEDLKELLSEIDKQDIQLTKKESKKIKEITYYDSYLPTLHSKLYKIEQQLLELYMKSDTTFASRHSNTRKKQQHQSYIYKNRALNEKKDRLLSQIEAVKGIRQVTINELKECVQSKVIESMQELETINKENVVIESCFIQGKESTKSKDSIYTDREEQAQEAIKQSMQQDTIKEVESSMQAQEIQPNMQDISTKEAQRKQAMCIMESMQAAYRKHAMQIQSLMHERITQSILYTMQTKYVRATQHIRAIQTMRAKDIALYEFQSFKRAYKQTRTRKGRDPPACHPLSL